MKWAAKQGIVGNWVMLSKRLSSTELKYRTEKQICNEMVSHSESCRKYSICIN